MSWSLRQTRGGSDRPQDDDIVILKKRISAFYGNGFELTLRGLGVQRVTIAGVATDLAVQSAARDAHDRDFGVRIVASACIAATLDDHQRALENMSKFAAVAD